jgi:anti-anti-sigma factor
MTDATLTLETHDNDIRIGLAGEVDMANADKIQQQMASAITNDTMSVTVDVADLRYIDSTGLRVLASFAARLRSIDIEFTLIAPATSPAGRVIELTGLNV